MSPYSKIEYLVSLFFYTGRLVKEKSHPGDTMDPISMLQLETLRLIEEEKPTMKRIAESLRIKSPSATSLVNSLVKAGHVKRKQSSADRRVVRMIITSKGKVFLKKGFRQVTEKTKEVLSKLKKKQIDDFIKIMEEIRKAYK
jgi:DNA-binding MarR family transcriptional regulator